MPNEGTGASITLVEAIDLLHKHGTENAQVVAQFTSPDGNVQATITGIIRVAPNRKYCVIGQGEPAKSQFYFDPYLSISQTYGDDRAMKDKGHNPFGPPIRSLVTFTFRDGGKLGVFEFDETSDAPE